MRRIAYGAVTALVVAGVAAPACAQVESEPWKVVVAPYVLGAAMNGSTTVRGREVDIEVSASEIFDYLQFGAMGTVVATRGNWGFGADLIWMALGATVRNTNVDFNQGAFSLYGLRRLSPIADAALGLRLNLVQGDIKFKGPDIAVEQDQSWVDPLVGLMLHSPSDHRFQLRLYSEIGGFGAGSDLTWQLFPTIGYRFTDKASFELGYRWLDTDYSTGEGNEEFSWDVLAQGPAAGFAFRF